MKYLGIDFGAKRIGLATGSDSECVAFPLKVLENTKNRVEEIAKIIEEEIIERIVIGESKDFSGNSNPIQKEIEEFAEELKAKLGIDIIFEPEFLTSAQAERIQGKSDMLDASSASIILGSYFDKLKNK